MSLEYSKDQLWPLYEKLPEDLKEAVFSATTADNIHNICVNNGVEEDKIPEVAKYTGYVLLGVLLPSDFEKILTEEVKLKSDTAKKINWEISRLVFFPVKISLEAIYKTEMTPLSTQPKQEKTSKARQKKDTYREPVE